MSLSDQLALAAEVQMQRLAPASYDGNSLQNAVSSNTTGMLHWQQQYANAGYTVTNHICRCNWSSGVAADPIVHHFTGAPKGEAKNVPCGVALTAPSRKGFRLSGITASTEIEDVTCLGCLRALVGKGKP